MQNNSKKSKSRRASLQGSISGVLQIFSPQKKEYVETCVGNQVWFITRSSATSPTCVVKNRRQKWQAASIGSIYGLTIDQPNGVLTTIGSSKSEYPKLLSFSS